MTSARMLFRSRGVVLALLVAALVTAAQVWVFPNKKIPRVPIADAGVYVSIAHDLYATGVYTDGRFPFANPGKPGMFFAPLYPALLSGVIAIDDRFRETVECGLAQDEPQLERSCLGGLGLLVPLQAAMATISALLVWIAGRAMCRSEPCAWIAMLLAMATTQYADYARQALTENLAFPLFTAATLATTLAIGSRRHRLWWTSAGFLWGLLALTRPSFVYAFYLCMVALALSALRSDWRRRSLVDALLLVAGYAVVVAPWTVRNALLFDRATITAGYAGYVMAPRMAYNAMTLGEWATSFWYWLPELGHLAENWLPRDYWRKLSFEEADSYYSLGSSVVATQVLAAAGSPDKELGYILRELLFPNLFKHILVTLSLAWRGVWIAKYWGLICVPTSVVVLAKAVRRRWWTLLIFSAPGWFLLGFHAFVSTNVTRYNVIMVPAISVAAAWQITLLWSRELDRAPGYEIGQSRSQGVAVKRWVKSWASQLAAHRRQA